MPINQLDRCRGCLESALWPALFSLSRVLFRILSDVHDFITLRREAAAMRRIVAMPASVSVHALLYCNIPRRYNRTAACRRAGRRGVRNSSRSCSFASVRRRGRKRRSKKHNENCYTTYNMLHNTRRPPQGRTGQRKRIQTEITAQYLYIG